MPTFSAFSVKNLSTCDERLQKVFREVIKTRDCRIICGHRSEADQDIAFASGYSKVKFPNSKHNSSPSLAVDVIPYPFAKEDWKRIERFAMLAGFVLGTAESMGIELRSGLDWDRDGYLRDHSFLDGPHYELIE